MKTKTTTGKKIPASENPHVGSDFDDFLREEGIYEEVIALAFKRAVSRQIQEILEHEKVSKTTLAKRMKTSRASVERILDPENSSLTLASLGKVATALDRKIEIRFLETSLE